MNRNQRPGFRVAHRRQPPLRDASLPVLRSILTGTNDFRPPAFVGRYELEDLGAGSDFGFLDLDSQAQGPPVGPPTGFEPRQAWMLQTSSALGRFSVGQAATRLNDMCLVDAE